jgi:hypothetical protein
MVRLRHRAPRWSGLWFSQQSVGLFDLPVLASTGELMRELRRGNLAVAIGAATLLAERSAWIRSPTVVYLGASTAPNFGLFKTIQWYGGGLVLTAIDHAHPRVMEGRPAARSDSPWAGYFRQLPKYELPQPTNLRTASGKWEQTVRELIDRAPLLVLDLRFPAEHVIDELQWVTAAEGQADKTILVTSDAGVITAVADVAFAAVVPDADACLAAIGHLTAKRATLLRPRCGPVAPDALAARVSSMMATRRDDLREALDSLTAADVSDPDVLSRVAQLLRLPNEFASVGPDGHLEDDLDHAVHLARNWSPLVWVSIHLEPRERPLFTIGHGDHGAALATYSTASSHQSFVSGLLAALLAAELRHAGAPATDEPSLHARPRWARSAFPTRLRPLGWLRDTHMGRRMDDAGLAAAATALDRELRDSTGDDREFQRRLHELFDLTPQPNTGDVTTSLEAAITFVSRLGLGLSVYVTVDGQVLAELGTSTDHVRWRWESEFTRVPPARALILELLRVAGRAQSSPVRSSGMSGSEPSGAVALPPPPRLTFRRVGVIGLLASALHRHLAFRDASTIENRVRRNTGG